MEIQGTITQVLPLQSGVAKASGKEWKKQDYILETQGQYPKNVCFSLWGDSVDRCALQVGEVVTAQIDIESREFNSRWYTEVRAWRLDRGLTSLQTPQTAPMQPQQYAPYQQPQPTPQPAFGSAPQSDLPF